MAIIYEAIWSSSFQLQCTISLFSLLTSGLCQYGAISNEDKHPCGGGNSTTFPPSIRTVEV